MKMKERLETSMLQKIEVKAKDVVWVKKNKEIKINNRLFDVKSYDKNGDLIVFTGLYDDEETLLEKKVNDLTGKRHSSFLSLIKVLTLFQSFFNNNQPGFTAQHQYSDSAIILITPALCSVTLKVPTPPPLL